MRMLGRKDSLAAIQTKLAEQKFVTIVGPGGIGKTTVAVSQLPMKWAQCSTAKFISST
jgi:predicted ATPase